VVSRYCFCLDATAAGSSAAPFVALSEIVQREHLGSAAADASFHVSGTSAERQRPLIAFWPGGDEPDEDSQ
jgi:hypothetical protein